MTLHGVSWSAEGPDGAASSLAAERVVARRRTGGGGLVVYQQILDHVVEEAVIEVEARGDARAALAALVDGIARLGAGSRSRIYFDGLELRVRSSEGGVWSIAAEAGRLSRDPDTLLLTGAAVVTPEGTTVRAPRAAFASGDAGVDLPAGYELDGRAFRKGRLVVGGDDRLARAAGRAIRYDDRIDRLERAVLMQLSERAPPELRPLIAAVLAHHGRTVSAPLLGDGGPRPNAGKARPGR